MLGHPVLDASGFLGAGSIRTYLGDYREAFWVAGGLCVIAATLFLSTRNAATRSEAQQQLAEEIA